MTYDLDQSCHRSFWSHLKVLCRGGSQVQVVLAAAYGSTDTDLEDDAIVTIFQPEEGSPSGVSLSLDLDEWKQLFEAFQSFHELKLDEAVFRYVWQLCGGQVRTASHQLCMYQGHTSCYMELN